MDALRERARSVPSPAWGAAAAAILVLIPGVVGLAVGQPLLFPSLGPTAFLQAETPDEPAARPYNVIVGHLVGLAAGYVAVALLASNAPPLFATHMLVPERVAASAVAVGLTLLVTSLLRASHPPAAATTLLVALGGFRLLVSDVVAVVVGVLIVAAAGEVVRQLRLPPRGAESRPPAGG